MTDGNRSDGQDQIYEGRVGRIAYGAARGAAIACGYAVTALAFLVAFEVLSRKLFNFSIQGADEIGGYVLAVVTALGFSVSLVTRGHTRIDIFLRGLGAGSRRWLNVLCLAALTAFSLFMTYSGFQVLSESIAYQSRASTPLQTPLWIPQSLWFVGLVLFSFVCVYVLARMFLNAIAPHRGEDQA